MKRKHNITITYLLILISIISYSCQQYIWFNGELGEKQLVINSLLYADSSVKVRVDLTNFIYTTMVQEGGSTYFSKPDKYVLVDNANVELYEDGNKVGNLTHSEKGVYLLNDFKPSEGKQYKITATYDTYGTAVGQFQMPLKNDILDIDTIKTFKGLSYNYEYDEMYYYDSIYFYLKFKDPPNKSNFYALRAFLSIDDNQDSTNSYLVPYEVKLIDKVLGPSYVYDYTVGGIFTDEVIDGKEVDIKFGLRFYNDMEVGADHKIVFELSAISEEMYRYYLTYIKSDEILGYIMSEPVIVYSNIENGTGIAGGETISRKEYIIKAK